MNQRVITDEYRALCRGDISDSWQEVGTASDAQVYFHCDEGDQYCKVFPRREGIRRCLNAIKGVPVRRAFNKQCLLTSFGFSSPEILSYGYCYGRHYLVTNAVQGMTLDAYFRLYGQRCREGKHGSALFREKRWLLRNLAEDVAKMHGNGLRYGDLNVRNIIVRKDYSSFVYLDYEASRRFYFGLQRHGERNLQQLNSCSETGLSKSDRVFFLKVYQQYLAKRFNLYCESLARNVMEKTSARKLRKESH